MKDRACRLTALGDGGAKNSEFLAESGTFWQEYQRWTQLPTRQQLCRSPFPPSLRPSTTVRETHCPRQLGSLRRQQPAPWPRRCNSSWRRSPKSRLTNSISKRSAHSTASRCCSTPESPPTRRSRPFTKYAPRPFTSYACSTPALRPLPPTYSANSQSPRSAST